MGMHTTILGIISLAFSVYLFIKKANWAGLGFVAIGLSLFFSFLIMMKGLAPHLIGMSVTILFFIGCCLVAYQFIRGNKRS